MHETKFTNEILMILDAKVDQKMRACPVVVNVRLSRFSHVTPKHLNETFKHLVDKEKFINVKLDIKPIEFDLNCRGCKKVSKCTEVIFNCPICGSADFDIKKDREFFVESLDVEK